MKSFNRILALASLALALHLGTDTLTAQERPGRGNFDPSQFRERMMERVREQLEVKNDDEWKVIEGRVEKVMAARREAAGGRGFGFGSFGRGRGGGDDDQGRGRGRGPRGRGGSEASPEVAALQKALESNASADEIKTKLAKVRQAREAKEAELKQAQEDLRQVLSMRQEAKAFLLGLVE